MRFNTVLFIASFFLSSLASEPLYRNWPHPGFDPQQSRFQTAQGLEVHLCGIAQNRNPFSTRAVQTVVFNGVQYYSKMGTASIFAFNLTTQATWWRAQDLVTEALGANYSSANLTSDIFIAIVNDPPNDNYVLAYFTAGVDTTHTTQKVVVLLDLAGVIKFKANTTASTPMTSALSLTVHPTLSLAILSSTTSLSALPLPFNNATRDDFDQFKLKWRMEVNGTHIPAPLVMESSRVAFLFPSTKLSIIKGATGDIEKEFSTFGEMDNLVFGMGTTVAMSNSEGGVLIDYASTEMTDLKMMWPLAVSNTSEFVAFTTHPNTAIVRIWKEGANNTEFWRTQANITGPVAASVDSMGIVYVVASGGEYQLQAYSLSKGTFLWQLKFPSNSSSVASPIIASSSVNSTFLLVDSLAGQYQFSPSCQGSCEADMFCRCNNNTYGAGCATTCTRNNTCNGHGSCQYDGSCLCDDNYYLSDCSVRCEHNKDCFNGTCSPVGTCECLKDYYSMKCNQFCTTNQTCSGNGTCDVDGNCSCHGPNGWFDTKIRVMPNCAWGVNYALVGIILAIIGLVGMCIGLCLCCFCEKSRKELPKNPSKLSLLKHKH